MKFFHLNNPAFYDVFNILEAQLTNSCLKILVETTNESGYYVDVFRIYGDYLSENQSWKLFNYGDYKTIEELEDYLKIKE